MFILFNGIKFFYSFNFLKDSFHSKYRNVVLFLLNVLAH